MPNVLTIWAIRARHLLSHVFEYWLWRYRYFLCKVSIFEVKLTFKMLTVRRQQHSFSTHKRMFLWKCQSFWDRKWLDLRGTRTPYLMSIIKCRMKLLIHSPTSTVQLLRLGMDKSFLPILYWACNYLSMLGLKSNHVSKSDYQSQMALLITDHLQLLC